VISCNSIELPVLVVRGLNKNHHHRIKQHTSGSDELVIGSDFSPVVEH